MLKQYIYIVFLLLTNVLYIINYIYIYINACICYIPYINYYYTDLYNIILYIGFFIIFIYSLTTHIFCYNYYNSYNKIYSYLSNIIFIFLIMANYEENTNYNSVFSYSTELQSIMLPLTENIKIIITIFFYIFYLSFFKKIINERAFYIFFWLSFIVNIWLIKSCDLIMIFFLLELNSFIILIYLFIINTQKNSYMRLETSIKYFFLNAIGSIFFLLFLSLIYSIYGTFNLDLIYNLYIMNHSNYYFILYNDITLIIFILTFFIKLGIFPFHQWNIDVIQCLPYVTISYINVISKLLYFISIYKIYIKLYILYTNSIIVYYIISILILNIIILAVLALYEINIKKIIGLASLISISISLLFLLTQSYILNDNIYIYIYMSAYVYLMIHIILSYIIFRLSQKEIQDLNYLSNIFYIFPIYTYIYICISASFIGLPPFIGFFIKVALFLSFINYTNSILIITIYFICSLFIYIILAKLIRNALPEKNQYYHSLLCNITRTESYICSLFFFSNIYFSIFISYYLTLNIGQFVNTII